MSENLGTWVYAVGEDRGQIALPELTGVGGAPVHAVAGAGLVAVVSPVDLAEYGEEPLRRNLENLEWLEAVARAHHDVIGAVSETGPVVPVQLATVYRSQDRITAMLADCREEFAAAVKRIRGRTEWGIKIYGAGAGAGAADSADSAADTAADTAQPADAARPGAAYLQRRRSQLSAREDARQAAASSAEAIHAELAGLAVAARLHKPQHPQLTGRSEPMILNSTYLVDDEQASVFAAAADELAGQHPGVRVELTGPWPPYSFTLPDDQRVSTGEGGVSG